MKRALWLAAALLVGAVAANVLRVDTGRVSIALRGTLVEMSLPVFVLALGVLWLVLRVALRAVRARRSFVQARVRRRRERARRALAEGLLELSQGDWQAAETTVTRAARDSEFPLVHYLVAARAADLQGERRRCDEWLAKALDAAPAERAPVLITQAEILLRRKQTQAALTTLAQLEASGERNARALVLLARIYRQTGDWTRLQGLEPELRATRGIAHGVVDEIVVQIYLDRLQAAGASRDFAQVDAAMQAMPASVAKRMDVIVAAARAAMATGQHAAAEKLLRDALAREWDEPAVMAFGELEAAEPLAALDTAERWLRRHTEDPALLLACARLSIRAELYGKAQRYLEASSLIRPRAETLQLLAGLLEQLGERERALQTLKDALVLAIGRRPSLPRVRAQRIIDRRLAERRRR